MKLLFTLYIFIIFTLNCFADETSSKSEESSFKLGAGIAYVSFPHYVGSDQTHRLILPYLKIKTKRFSMDDDNSMLRVYKKDNFKIDFTVSGRLPVYAADTSKEEEKGIEFIRPTEKNSLRYGMNDLSFAVLCGVEMIYEAPEYFNIEFPVYRGLTIGDSSDIGYTFAPKMEFKLLKDGYKNNSLNIFYSHLYATKEYNRYYYGIKKQYVNSVHTKEYKPSGGMVYQRYGIYYEYAISDKSKSGVYFSRYNMTNSVVEQSTLVARKDSSTVFLFYSTFF